MPRFALALAMLACTFSTLPAAVSAHTATAPTKFVVSGTTDTTVKLDWTQSYAHSYSGYFMRVDGGARVKYAGSEGTVDGLGAGTTHRFCVSIDLTTRNHPDESAQSCISATTSAAATTPPPSVPGSAFYASDSFINKPVPTAPRVHPRSADMVRKVTSWGAPTSLRPGESSSSVKTVTDNAYPVFYASESDPLFTVMRRSDGYSSDWYGQQIRIPQHARAGNGVDAAMAVVAPDGRTEWFGYKWSRDQAGTQPLSSLPSGGGTIYVRGFGKHNLLGDPTATYTRYSSSKATAAGWGAYAGVIRPEEMQAGEINHALKMKVKSTGRTFDSDGIVPPAIGAAALSDATNSPPNGARFWLDMTAAEIEALPTGRPNKTILKAMAKYGMFVGDTTGAPWGLYLQSGFTWTPFGLPDKWREWGAANAGSGGLSYYASDDVYVWNFKTVVDWASKLKVLDWSDPANR